MENHARLALAVLLIAGIHFSGAVTPLDNALAALRMNVVQRAATDTVTVVGIDAKSLRSSDVWPWPRERFAQAIKNLRDAGAALIAFDVDFSASSSPSGDAALKAAIDTAPGWIVLPTFVQRDARYENSPLASLSENALLGSVNINLDGDGKVRSYARGYQHGDHYHPTLGAILANAQYGDNRSFLIDYGIRASDIDQLSFENVVSNNFDPQLVRGRSILIGATALELGDEYSTPVAPAMSGVLVHALAYESLAQGRALVRPADYLLLGLGILALLALWPRRSHIELSSMLARHAAVLALAGIAPLAIQAFTPLLLDTGLVMIAQGLCIWEGVRRELSRRTAEITRQRDDHLAHIARHDPETLLPNRRAMLERLSALLAAANGREVLAVAVGIERFATLRGAIGYARSNEVVAKLAQRLKVCDTNGQVFHLSTSILGIVVDAESAADAISVWKARLGTTDPRINLAGQEIELEIRGGIAAGEGLEETSERMLERATVALDKARLRKAGCVVHSAGDGIDPRLQLALVADVTKGLARREFDLVYQPKVSARGGQVVGAEALMRWTHPEFGVISPELFIRVAEETGSIDALTRWALERAIHDQMLLRARGAPIQISVNLSAKSLCDAVFCQDAIDLVKRAGADLCLEITETALMSSPQAAAKAIEELRAGRIDISIDDYGSGLSSLAYLKQIAADELKLDRGLIQDVTTNIRDRMILKSTIDLAHALGMKVVAEGVEDAISCAALSALGCDILQGYHVGRPQSILELADRCGQAPPAQKASLAIPFSSILGSKAASKP